MKRCPSCNRTYSDETLSFCLADGTLLSAPYNDAIDDAEATVILPSRANAIPPTQQAFHSRMPTLAVQSPLPTIDNGSRTSNRNPQVWILTAIACALIILAAAIFVYEETWKSENLSAIAASPTPTEDLNKLLSPAPIPTGTPAMVATPSPYVTAPTIEPTRSTSSRSTSSQTDNTPAPTPTDTGEPDYSRIFPGSDVTSKARVLEKPEPAYTETAKRNQITGTVVLRAVFSASGQVTNIHAVSTLPDGLTEQAIEAAKKIRFVPAMKDGHPVSMWMELQYNFNLY